MLKEREQGDVRALQKKSLETFLYFKEICDENNLLCYLCGGGCIGAIREKGFIPWDDDIDVFMPRDDYERLCELWDKVANTENFSLIRAKEPGFSSQIFTTISNNSTTLIKPHQSHLDMPHGVTIDVFPLDGYPRSRLARKFQLLWALIYSLYLAQIIPQNHGKLVTVIGKILLWIVPSKNLRFKVWRCAEKKMSKHKISECEYITELCAGPYYMRKKYPKELFSRAIYREFEGEMVPLPVGYDKYLRTAFGDYMQLPPQEKRVAHHDIEFMDLTKSYREYKGLKYCVCDNISRQ